MIGIVKDASFGILLTLAAYMFGVWLREKTGKKWLVPFAVSLIFIVAVLAAFRVDYADYMAGGEIINSFLGPCTVILAVPIYRRAELLKKNLLPILCGITAGVVANFFTVYLFCRFFLPDKTLFLSILPHSITTPCATSLSASLGAVGSVTVLALLISGMLGPIFCAPLSRLFRIKPGLASGIAIGSSSHIIGTAKAAETSELEGSCAGLSIGLTGIITSLIVPLLLKVFYL